MHLKRIEVRHLRNLTSISLSPAIGLNILEGNNASGKTSFLEAIYMLGLARSFRTIRTKQLVQEGFEDLLIFAELEDSSCHRLGLQRFTDNRMVIRLNGETVQSRAQLVQLLPIQLTTPDSLSLIIGPPGERRRFLDWIMFHVEPSFHETWSQYHRTIRQRNALLRESRLRELPAWSEGLVALGNRITAIRRVTVEELTPSIMYYLTQLLPGVEVKIGYRQGWKQGQELAEAIAAGVETDLRQKYTGSGPHRADLIFTIDNQPVAELLSRGQIKLFLCALKLAQLEYLKRHKGKNSVVLIDDLPAELDESNRALLLGLLHGLDTQVFVTTTDRSHLDHSAWSDVKVFHVEHGKIKEVV